MRVVPQSLQDRLYDARFANAGFARNQDHLPIAQLGLFPSAKKQVDLLVAANQRRSGCSKRLEPALGGTFAQRLPRGDILSEPLESDRPKVAVLEQAADQPVCGRCNHHCPRLG
jgi:hypothetical protein